MTLEQAQELLDYIAIDRGLDAARMYQIANGEWVVRLKARDYWLWNFSDYTAYRQTQETQARQAVAV